MNRLLWMLCVCLMPAFVLAQNATTHLTSQKQIAEQKAAIEKVEAALAADDVTQEAILENRQLLRLSRDSLQEVVKAVTPLFDDVKADIADLGPVPEGENALPEPKNIQKKRAALIDESLRTEGLIKEAEALIAKSARLLEKVASIRKAQFISRLFETQTSPFDNTLWYNAGHAFSEQVQSIIAPVLHSDTWQELGLILSLGLFLFLCVSSILFSKKLFKASLHNKPYSALSCVAHSLVLPVFGASIGLFVVFQALMAQGMMNPANAVLMEKTFVLMVFIIVLLLIAARLAAAGLIRPNTSRLVSVVGIIYVLDAFFLEAGRSMGAVLELAIVQSYAATTFFALALGILSYGVLKNAKDNKRYFLPRELFLLLCGTAILLLGANIFGYAALSRLIFERAIMLASLLISILLIRALIRPYLAKIDRLLAKNETRKDDEENLIYFWLALSLDIVLLLVALPVLASILGAETSAIKEWGEQALFGFSIGSITISIVDIGIAIFLFIALLFITRLLQNVLSAKILPKTKMDASIQQSVIQILGYVGLIIALLSGISAVGFDLTNLALIAGALSVGIGFGLQSIVNNFVSGLILLFERPIKVNDWIITNSGEGIVKKISVRATEIETFDKTSIIVPNSELIASSVKNWTHKDKIGRVIVTVGVSYHSDPHQVKALLMQCAEQSGFTLKSPEPSVHFKDFGDNALIFDLRFFIRNVSDVFTASTQMRLDIWDSFKHANIEISFPQRDLHIRSAPGLEGLFNRGKDQ